MGLLDDLYSDPNQMGMMGAAMGLLNSSGPSRTPVSLGQVLSQGMQGGMGAYKSAYDMQKEQVQMKMLMQRQQMVNQALQAESGNAPQTAPQGSGFNPEAIGSQSSPMGGGIQPAPQGSPSNGWSDGRISAYAMSGDPGLMKSAELAQARNLAQQTEFTKMLDAAHITDPGMRAQLIQANLAKTNYTAPVNARPGSIIRDPMDPSKVLAFNPHIPEAGMPQFDQGGNVIAITSLPGATGVMEQAASATAGGKNSQEPITAFNPITGQFEYTNKKAAATGGNMPLSQQDQAAIAAFKDNPPGAPFNLRVQGDHSLPAKSGALAPAPPPGFDKGQTLAQDELSKKFATLQEQNSQAQITSSYLQNIKQEAKRAAVGPMSDKINFANGMLSLVGNERATDAVTANALLDKYANQITTRLGTGGLGTDAARSMLQSAYPNAHMPDGAIDSAADNLIGANDMVKAKTTLLSPHGHSRDPIAYQQKEMIFDQNADPRIWQLKNMSAADGMKFLAAMPANVRADLKARAVALKSIGAY